MISVSPDEALDEIEIKFGKSDYGKEKYSSAALFWMGYLYRYISYTRDINTHLLFKTFNSEQLNSLYYTYHTQDPEWCVRNLLELNGLSEEYFDKNWRLKQIILKEER